MSKKGKKIDDTCKEAEERLTKSLLRQNFSNKFKHKKYSETEMRALWERFVLYMESFKNKGYYPGHRAASIDLNISTRLAEFFNKLYMYRDVFFKKSAINLKTTFTELVLADLHVPYHDEMALRMVLKYAKQYKPELIVLLGDIIDFYQVSKYNHTPRRHEDILDDIEKVKEILGMIRNEFPDTRIIYLQGNHEERLQKYITGNAKEIYFLISNLYEEKLELEKYNIEYKREFFKVGKLWHLHGHERPGGSYNPEYISNVMMKYIYDNFIVGHFHRTQQKSFTTITGEVLWGLAVGYLGTALDYAKLNNWTQGFAIIEYKEGGDFVPMLKTIHGNTIY